MSDDQTEYPVSGTFHFAPTVRRVEIDCPVGDLNNAHEFRDYLDTLRNAAWNMCAAAEGVMSCDVKTLPEKLKILRAAHGALRPSIGVMDRSVDKVA